MRGDTEVSAARNFWSLCRPDLKFGPIQEIFMRLHSTRHAALLKTNLTAEEVSHVRQYNGVNRIMKQNSVLIWQLNFATIYFLEHFADRDC